MTRIDRRRFVQLAASVGVSVVATGAHSSFAIAEGKGKVVIIGGGAGGASVAHYLKKGAPQLDVTLIEIQAKYTTCFFSNLYLGGFRTLDSITHDYEGLKKLGIKVISELATGVDTTKKQVTLKTSDKISYDKLVLSPGIDFKYDAIEGYSAEVAKTMPHAWKAGIQTQILKTQLKEMKAGGTVVMAAPPNPYRCPPGPYERASMIAHFLKTNKPGSKLMIFDTKEKFSKMALFQEGWLDYYENIIEWVSPEFTDGGVKKVDVSAMTVTTGDGEVTKADVANIIPAQKAGKIAHIAGCAKGDWCPINPKDFSSALKKDVYVIGDSSIAKAMPKSAFSANSQARVVANAIQAELVGKRKFPARYRNTCWSMISVDNSVKVGANYTAGPEALITKDKFISKTGETDELRKKTFNESLSWYDSITTEMFVKS